MVRVPLVHEHCTIEHGAIAEDCCNIVIYSLGVSGVIWRTVSTERVTFICMIWGFHGGECEDHDLLGCDAVYVCMFVCLFVFSNEPAMYIFRIE
jgi:hypothetical protein